MSNSYCIFSAQYPPHLGGVEGFTFNVARELVDKGSRVVVVTNDTEKLTSGFSLEKGVEVLRLPCFSLAHGRLPLPFRFKQRKALLKQIEDRDFDGVLVNTRFYPHSILGIKFANKHALRAVVLDHGSAFITFGNRYLDIAVRTYEKAITAYGKTFTPVYYGISRRSCDWLRTFDIAAQGVIPNAIDAPAFRELSSERDFRAELNIASDWLVISFVGRFVPEKGVMTILDLIKSDYLKDKRVTFVFAGDGPLIDEISASECPACHMVGRLDKKDVSALLQQSDLFCLPSRSEGFATSLLEASACGCPSIVTDVGGARELIPDSAFGTILGNVSVGALAEVIDGYLEKRDEIIRQSINCKELVDHAFTWKDTVSKLMEAFANAKY